jgi:signal transduction histidine kinase/ligand-binding sensor domain-containing protein
LPDNTVFGVVQTPDDYLWLGTPSGLVRFDGIRFESFSSTNFISEPHRGVLTMIRSRDGGLRLAMDRGAVVWLNADGAKVFLPRRDLPDRVPYSLMEDFEGALWVIYRGGGVCRIQEGKVRVFTAHDGLPASSAVCSMECDNEGGIWFSKGGQFGEFREGRFQVLRSVEPSVPLSGIGTKMAPAREGGLWICSGARLFRFEKGGKWEELGTFGPPRAGTTPNDLLEDREGAVWIATSYSGLFRFASNRFESVPTSQQEITSLEEDREGNIWLGTAGGGLNRVRLRAITLEGTESGLPYEGVQSICEDIHGGLWAVTQNGLLAHRTDGKWAAIRESAPWSGFATCVAPDPSGGVWIGTRLNGLFRGHNGEFTAVASTNEPISQTIHTLVVSKNGDLWIGAETPVTAVQRLRGAELRNFPVPPDIRIIRACAEDTAGNIWFGTSKGVLLRANGDQLTEETANTSKEPLSIRYLHATADGSVWIGHAGFGLGRIKNGQYSRLTTERGLYDDWLSEIMDDGRGWLWLGGNRGIFKVRQSEIDDLDAGRTTRIRSVHYGRGEGLPSLQATSGATPGVCRTRDGRLWFPMRTGLAVVDPARLRELSEPPSTLLTRVAADERTVALYGGVMPVPGRNTGQIVDLAKSERALRLPPEHRRLQFDFAALTFTSPASVTFRYRLEPIDEDWIEGGTERHADYSRLAAGKYHFRVIACSSDGLWNEAGAALGFVVLPFFWQTWWFRAAVVAAFTLSVIAIVRYASFRRLRARLRVLEQQAALHKERARIAKDIHDDVGANLTQIALLGELAQQELSPQSNVPGPESADSKLGTRDSGPRTQDSGLNKANERIQNISSAARQAVKSLDEIVWAVNPRNDTLAHLIDYTGQFALDYLRLAGIRCRLDFPEPTPQREVSTDVRHNLFLVVKEALHNIVKHAHATEVWLKVNADNGAVRLIIEDNGHGFEQAPDDALADGLRNMRQRMSEIGGECRIESKTGTGTKITAELPWPPNSGSA